jgi:hypothetical protein
MPEKAAQLHVWLRGFSLFEKVKAGSRSEEEMEVKDALREFDFSIFETWEPTDGRQIHTYPFEDREENRQQINEFVQHLEQKYPEADIELKDEGSMGRPGQELPAQQFYMIIVDTRTQSNNQ